MNKSLLLHVCCAHCAAYSIEYWRKRGFEPTAFWFNPNIHPQTEYQQRLEAIRSLSSTMNFPLIVTDFDAIVYFQAVSVNVTDRCRFCFILRLRETASRARADGYHAFSSTLLISPHQKHELIQEAGNNAAAQFNVEFLYTDLRKRYSDSRRITKPLNLYRQQYCGCIYSELERESEIEAHNPKNKIIDLSP